MFSANSSQVSNDANYIEDVFSTYLYTGNGSTQTITNGIDLSTKGGLVWTKVRSTSGFNHMLSDTARGAGQALFSDLTSAQANYGSAGIGFTTSGFTVGAGDECNSSGKTLVGWTFRKQAKFFDVVTYTGTGVARTIAHSLGSVPACIIVKCTNAAGKNWQVYHTSLGNASYINLNLTSASTSSSTIWNSTTPTSTVFSLGADGLVNDSGDQYVAYLFAHNAGGFGLTGTDNVISCGSYTGNGSTDGPVIDLGYEPQWLLIKSSSASSTAWTLIDNMRGMTVGGADAYLKPNSSDAETTSLDLLSPTATGFKLTSTLSSVNGANDYIYIAIRRGPMKVPTSGTSVFSPVLRNGTGANANIQSGFPTDLIVFLNTNRDWDAMGNYWTDRMRSGLKYLTSTATNAEGNWNNAFQNNNGFDTQNGVLVTSDVANGVINHSGTPYINWMFRRATSFFDEVCYTGNGSTQNITHNLGVAPEFLIVKPRNSSAYDWNCYHVSLGNTKYIALNTTLADSSAVSLWNNTTPTSTVFTVNHPAVNDSGGTYVAYLFATCTGVSKVGSYTGTGATKQIDCGFTGGARFVLIKRTDSTGDWYVWDTARGIVSGNDPYLLLNSTAAETTGTDYIDPYSAGFEISSTAPAAINASGGTFIFLAIA